MDTERINSKLMDLASLMEEIRGTLKTKSAAEYAKENYIVKRTIERDMQLISEVQLDIIIQVYKSLNLAAPGEEKSIITAMEKVILTDSACPVFPVRTSSYEGFFTLPPQ